MTTEKFERNFYCLICRASCSAETSSFHTDRQAPVFTVPVYQYICRRSSMNATTSKKIIDRRQYPFPFPVLWPSLPYWDWPHQFWMALVQQQGSSWLPHGTNINWLAWEQMDSFPWNTTYASCQLLQSCSWCTYWFLTAWYMFPVYTCPICLVLSTDGGGAHWADFASCRWGWYTSRVLSSQVEKREIHFHTPFKCMMVMGSLQKSEHLGHRTRHTVLQSSS